MNLDKPAKPLLTYGTYPTLALVTGVTLWATLRHNLDRNAVIGVLTVMTIAIVFAIERLNPLRDRWSMTRQSLIDRDLPFIGLAVVVEQVFGVRHQRAPHGRVSMGYGGPQPRAALGGEFFEHVRLLPGPR